MPKNALVEFEHAGVRLGAVEVLSDITCGVEGGKLTALIGPNGSGKTTLLRAILGMVPHTGTIRLNVARQRVGYVPQRLEFERGLPVTVEGFMRGLLLRRPLPLGGGASGSRLVRRVLDAAGAGHLAASPLGALSGGEMQRVLLALALEPEPELLLLDEPASGLDMGAEALLYDTVRRLVRERGTGVLMVSHDLSVVSDMTDHVLCVNRRLVCEGGAGTIFTDENIAKIFGEGRGIYQHHHHHGHDHA